MTDKIVSFGGQDIPVSITSEGPVHHVSSGERSDTIEVLAMRNGEAELRVNGRRVIVPFVREGSSIHFSYDGETYRAEVSARAGRRPRQREHSMSAPMPGLVLKISAKVGDVVARGAPLIILEAMKMEHQITAPYDGVVRAIHCAPGQLVQPGLDLIALIPQPSDEDQR